MNISIRRESVKDFIADQALGLLQMLGQSAARVVAVTGGPEGVGRTAAVANLAMALTKLDMDVLVVDERPSDHSASAMLGGVRTAGAFAPPSRCRLPRVLTVDRRPPRLTVMGSRHTDLKSYADGRYDAVFDSKSDIVLIDAALGRDGGLSPLALQADNVVVVMCMSADAAADTYVCMKRLRLTQGIAEFRILVNLLDGEADTHAVLDSLGSIARDYLAVSVVKAGCIAADPCAARAAELSRCVVDAFPSSPAASDYRRLAADMQSWPRRRTSVAPTAIARMTPRVAALASHSGLRA
jgi:flagellar biosynthesis protein FlhG